MEIPTGKAHIAIDKINGKKYYYAEWSVREKVDKRCSGKTKGSGKSKVINHRKYIGPEKKVLEKLTGSNNSPQKVSSKEYGLPMSILTIAEEVGLIEIMDDVLPYKVNGIKASEYILISALSKLNGSISKESTGDYFDTTVLPYVMNIKAKDLHSKSYWSMFEKIISEKILKEKKKKNGKSFHDKLTVEELEDLIDDKKLEMIEERLWSNLLTKYNVLLDKLLYDGTNYFTYYQDHTRNSYGQKGRNKKSRHNLRQIGLFIAVTGNGFPFISQLACGNINDATLFPTAMSKLIKRYHKVIDEAQKIRITFDKGNNSKKNIKAISQTEYIGSLIPSSHLDLMAISLDKYTNEYKNSRVYECRKKVYDSEHKIFITYNNDLKISQKNTFKRHIKKVITALTEKYKNYKKIKVEKLKKELNGILKGNKILDCKASQYLHIKISNNALIVAEYPKRIINKEIYSKEKRLIVDLIQAGFDNHKIENEKELIETLNTMLNTHKVVHSKACRYLDYEIKDEKLLVNENEKEIAKKENVFGKNIIFTNKLDANYIETISGYKDKQIVEDAFEKIKDHRLISLHPLWHWTDTKIRIDAFISVLAYFLIILLTHLAEEEGLKMSIKSLITALKGIREVIMVYSDKTVERKIEELLPLQEKLLKKFKVIN